MQHKIDCIHHPGHWPYFRWPAATGWSDVFACLCMSFVCSLYLCLCMFLHLFVFAFAFVSKEDGARVSDGRSVRGRTGWLTQTICSQTAPTHRFTATFGGKSGPNGFLCGKVTLPFLADGLGIWNSHEMKLIEFSQSI